MSEMYNSIMQGLIEAVDDAKGKTPLKRNLVEIEPLKQYDAQKIKGIRSSVGFSQKLFAGYLGVSQKTVEAWEAGINIPNGTASRLLQIMEQNPDITNQYQFVKIL
jgi:putative transcriptional regulator